MIVLDTNVLSELLRPDPSPAVLDWFSRQDDARLFTTTLTKAEMLLGVRLLPPGKRQSLLEAAVQGLFDEDMVGKVLPFDGEAARCYAEVVTARRRLGRPVSQLDAQIAAIALSHRAVVATRNVKDFEGCGVEVVDPWGGGE